MGVWETIEGYLSDGYDAAVKGIEGGTDASIKILKESLKQLVKLDAGRKLKKKNKIVKTYKEIIKEDGAATKTAIMSISNQLNTNIKGQFSKSITETVSEKADGYDNL